MLQLQAGKGGWQDKLSLGSWRSPSYICFRPTNGFPSKPVSFWGAGTTKQMVLLTGSLSLLCPHTLHCKQCCSPELGVYKGNQFFSHVHSSLLIHRLHAGVCLRASMLAACV